ncbi:MAG: 3-phosphoshikimate 1-carboxyvinyltransferase, partial [archaeon]|nr:3-phosphoshikimate 1-carboxyvinyltransferase [archaeon]
KDFVIEGTGGNLRAPSKDVFVENSGVTARFLIPLAALAEGDSVIDGSERMRQRPLQDLIDSLEKVGVHAEADNDCPPVKVKGKSFDGGITTILGNKSSQYLSAMLISAPYTKKGLLVQVEGELKSKPYVDITMECMASFGVPVVNRRYKEFYVRENQAYKATEYLIEGDYSSASYFFAAAAVTGGKVRVENLNPDSRQGDKYFLKILEQMGCKIIYGKNFVEVQGSKLKGITVDMADYPDIVPTLGVVAAFAEEKTIITNVSHLALKESNRLKTTAKNLMQCGVPSVAREDSLEIVGKKPRGAEIETFNDHRIAMAFSVMGLAVEGIKIRNPEVVNKSFPNFYDEFEKVLGV